MGDLWTKGRRFRVVKPGASLIGLAPMPGCHQGWSRKLEVGDILTCDGEKWTSGDGAAIIAWLDANGGFLAVDCEFQPSLGGTWDSKPDASYLQIDDPEAVQ